jgi:Hypothetical glycosyl hydrolase family 15
MRAVLTFVAIVALSISVRAAAFDNPPFPRLAAVWTGNQNYQDATIQQALARGSIAVINTWPGWATGRGTTVEQVIRNIKTINPNTLVFQYISNNEIASNASLYPNFATLYTELTLTHWYLYVNGGCCTVVPSAWAGATEINNTLLTPPDTNGDHWPEWFAKWAVKQFYVPNPSLDGFWMDNVMWRPRVNGDWNRDGTTDLATDPTVGTWLRTGERRHFDTMHTLMPGKYQLGNTDFGSANAIFPELDQQLNGGLMEQVIGTSWSYETWGGWTEMMRAYRKWMAAFTAPKLGVFQQKGSATDYQGFRYGLTSCLMDDGYFAYTTTDAYGDAPMFDEYNAKLGASTTSPPRAAWQKGVYRRDFENGIALVNPKGNGAQTITLEADFKRLAGTQVPAVNSGQTVRTLTLQDRDGIILMRLQPVAAPKRPAPPSGLTVH